MHAVTPRLDLSPLTLDDVDDVFEVYSNPDTWTHMPEGRYTSPEQARDLIIRSLASLDQWGLGEWGVRIGADAAEPDLPEGTFIGAAGMKMSPGGVWNLGYRLSPTSWGRGFAHEAARAAVAAAAEAAPEVPVTARVLANNPASIRVIERLGLELLWEGHVAASVPGTDGEQPPLRRVYTDRELSPEAYAWIVENA
ncbi:MAG: GNAT family N-acetyltransferase [Microterricola sp.]